MSIPETIVVRKKEPPQHPRGVSYRKPIDAAKDAVPVLDLAERLVGGPLVRKGHTYMARCPLPDHEEKTPSFTVYADNGRGWACFGCGRGGDVVHLYALARGHADMRVAAAELLMEFGHELPQRPQSWFRKQERQKPVRDFKAQARFEHQKRRIFRVFFAPLLVLIEDEAEREEATAALWEATDYLARMMRERRST